MYTGWMSGNYVEWPIIESCLSNTDFDPRFRPWFANAATGPKDIIIFIETSDSIKKMGENLIKSAAKQVLKTLTE